MLDREAEQVGFLAFQTHRGAGDGDGLRRDHLAGDATRGVGRHGEFRRDADLVRRAGLQRAEQGVGRGVGAGEEDADPAQEGREEREGRTGPGQHQGQRGRQARVVGHEGKAQHQADGEDGQAQFEQRLEEGLDDVGDAHVQQGGRDEGGQQNGGADGAEQVQLEFRGVGRGLGHDRGGLHDQVVQAGPLDLDGGCVEHVLQALQRPEADADGEDGERRPGLQDLARGVFGLMTLRGLLHAVEGEDLLGLPFLQEQRQADQADQRGGDIGQFGANEVGGEELGDGKRDACHQHGGPGLADAAHAIHHGHQPEGHDDGEDGQLATGHLTDVVRVQCGNLAGHQDGDTHGAEGHRGGVGDEAQASGIERVEAQAHQQRGGDGHRRTKTCGTFQEGTKRKTDQQHLQALVFRDGDDRCADDVELAGLDGDLVEEYRRDDDPGDGP